MNKEEILTNLKKIYTDVTGEKDFELELTSLLHQVPGWDSLANLSIISGVQDLFKVKITTKDIFAFRTIDDICNAIENNIR